MSRDPNRIRQADIERAVRAVNRAGLSISRIEVDPATGKISIHVGGAAPELSKEAAADAAFDEWERDNARAAQRAGRRSAL
jgi:hypothetical protein